MPSQNINVISGVLSLEELCEQFALLQKQVRFLQNKGMDSENVREIGGWIVGEDTLTSKDNDVGLSTLDTAGDDIRFFAGDVITGAPKFTVTKSGIVNLVSAILKSVASGERLVVDSTGLRTFDASNVERLTIGTGPAKGIKAVTFRDTAGTAQGVATYDVENVDGGNKTGLYYTAHGCYLLFDTNGDVRMQAADGKGFRAVSGTPEINDGFGWTTIAKAGVATSTVSGYTRNGGIAIGTQLAVSGGGSVTWQGITIDAHEHTQN